ncbi:Hsp33 family molecular chaperone HslO [Spirochaeta africana]|uniref:Disulfide bond chaperone n=1 Tax=Spirochaeta africana (strain ATCC 700263 / DSM 8902 / Z-7692) TaxID=889378 RepID=H9UGZ4_SPIAZ|nr:Hsp33 family molecular chaperone HslO [Spirochaeta africana]AFG36787.1 disulfide bond chaperone [Spirochaeta africana DSM 8902]
MIYRPLPAPVQKALEHIPEDGLDVFLLAGGSIRGVIVQAARLIHQARANHGLSPIETTVLGRGLLTGALHSGGLKGKDRAAFKVHSQGAVGGMSVEANVLGEIRGYLQNSIQEQDIPADIATTGPSHDGRHYRDTLMQISDRILGSGTLSVTRFPEGAREPATSTVAFADTGLDQVFESFYLQSEQVPTRIWTSFAWDDTLMLQSAAGLMLQTLPESPRHSREAFLPIVQYLETLDLRRQLAELSLQGKPASEIARQMFADFDVEIVGSKGIEFFCSCSKDRFGTFIQGLPAADRNEIREHGPFPLDVTCHYCGSRYAFSREELQELLG